ncbi:MAG: hypothetical protein ACYDD1_16770 [Caulobacteraceae bacterium]
MSEFNLSSESTGQSAYAFRQAVLCTCWNAEIADLLDLADDLHDLIRLRRSAELHREERSWPKLQVTATEVFLD